MATFFSVTYGSKAEDVYYFGEKDAAFQALKILSQGRYASFQPMVSEYTLASHKQFNESETHWVWSQAKDKVIQLSFEDSQSM